MENSGNLGNTKKYKLPAKVYITIALIGFLNSVIYSIPYIKTVFYDGMLQLTGASNAQLGWLMTIYGLGEVITLGIGGILAEKLDYRKILLISSMFTSIGCITLMFIPSLLTVSIVWFLLVFSTLFMFWGSLFKGLRLLGPDESQGKITGLYYGMAGVGYFFINMILLFVYDFFMKRTNSPADGMKAVFGCLAIFTIILAVLAYIGLKRCGVYENEAITESKNDENENENETAIKRFIKVARYPGVWFFGGTLFCVYSMSITIQYFTPYFENVIGIAVVIGGFLAIVRTYGMQAIGSPVGGIIADKIGSSAKVVLYSSILSVITIFAVLCLPSQLKTVPVLIAIMLLAACFNGLNYGVQYSIVSEAKIPREFTAGAVGIGSTIGFIPDVFQHTLFGYWIDNLGNDAYTYIFIYGIGAATIGIILLVAFLRYKKKNLSL